SSEEIAARIVLNIRAVLRFEHHCE
ncbi:MAG: hypothetical protein RLZZ163_286, partial [Actinomycetota bacterium]